MNTAKLSKFLMVFVGVSGAFSVLFGAWLAHVGVLLPVASQLRLEKALTYQWYHTLALLACLLWHQRQHSAWLLAAALCFFAGIIAFSFTLYAKTLFDLVWIAQAAPLGGISMASGWLLLAVAGKKLL